MTLQSILERVERASGADRELDFLVATHFGDVPEHEVREVGWNYVWYRRPGQFTLWKANDSEGRNVSSWTAEPITASLDATLALVERVLPGHQMLELYQCEDGSWGAHWRKPETETAYHSRPALALLAAMLRAKIGEDQ